MPRPSPPPTPGFVVIRESDDAKLAVANAAADDVGVRGVSVSHSGIFMTTTRSRNIVLIDGYTLGREMAKLVDALEEHDDEFLSELQGHYCAVLIRPDGEIQGFCDRFGARTLYWQTSSRRLAISSRWASIPMCGHQWDDEGLGEVLRYRWLTGQQTLVQGVSRLPHWNRVTFPLRGEAIVRPASQQINWPTGFTGVPFSAKLNETRNALTETLRNVAASYDKSAILLSGGVDSSLLAALSKACFKQALLVTPVFPNAQNPELDAARAVARKLQLEHLLVNIDNTQLEQDLNELIRLKGDQVTFHSMAMSQLVRAIPDDYKLLIHGEAADSLFGSSAIRQVSNRLRWKPLIDLVPATMARKAANLPIGRAKQLGRLKSASLIDIGMQHYLIQYDGAAMEFIRKLYDSNLENLYAHRVLAGSGAADPPGHRKFADIALRTSCAHHFRETVLVAGRNGKEAFFPFMSKAVIRSAKTLTADQYYGKEDVKPILRELACEHFERDLIYRRKHGFEVPYQSWLAGPLAHLAEKVRQERQLFDGQLLDDLRVDEHPSLFWSLINWQLLNDQLLASENSLRRQTA